MITALIVNNHSNKFAELSDMFAYVFNKCEILSAESVSDAIKTVQLKLPDVIVIQSDFSYLDRSNLCERLKNNRQIKDIPVVLIVSEHTERSVLEQSLEEGVIGFLREPVSMIEFSSLIKIVLRMKKAEDRLLEQRLLDEQIAEDRIKDLKIVENKYCKIFNSSNDIVLIYDIISDGILGKIIDTNEFACAKLGWDKSKILGSSPFGFLGEKFCMSIPKFMDKILREKTVVFETAYKTKNNGEFPVEVKTDLIEVHKSKFILSVAKDLTEKKTVEDKLHKSEERYRIIAEKTGYAVYDYDLDKEKIQWSGSVRTITGYKPTELQKFSLKDLKKLIHKEDIEYVMSIFNRALKTFSNYQIEHRLETKNGDCIYIENSGVFVKDANEKPRRILGVMKDISERKRAEKALRESEKKFRLISESSVVGFVILQNNNVSYVNKAVARIFGYTIEEISMLSIVNLSRNIHKQDYSFVKEKFSRAPSEIKEKLESHFQCRILSKNKEIRWIDMFQQPIIYKGESSVLLSVVDITENKIMEQELIKNRQQESIGILAGGIAHDFNNLLTAILGNISLAKMEVDRKEDLLEFLFCAEEASVMAKELSMQLLTFSKGGAPIRKTALIEEVVRDSARFALKGSNVKCDISVKNELSPVEIDVGQMNQVLSNLIINASQAMPDGGIIDIICDSTSVSKKDKLPLKKGKYVRIKVSDTGSGISKECMEKIFNPYFTTKDTGNGLGLAITHSIVKKHDGHIYVESEIGVGTVFTIYLPVSSNKLKKSKRQTDEVVCGKGRILIMDDEEMVRNVCRRILTRLGYSVDFAVDGCDAIEKYKAALETDHPFDAVIMDLTIPGGMGGKNTTKKLLKIDPNVKAIVASGYYNDPVLANFKEYSFCDVIAKPYTAKELGNILRQVLDG